MKILAIDPGHQFSAFVVYNTATKIPEGFGYQANADLVTLIMNNAFSDCNPPAAIEWISCYGMAVGQEIFLTCRFCGRLEELFRGAVRWVVRPDVKTHLCQNRGANDKFVREAVCFRYGGETEAIGGGKCPLCQGKVSMGKKTCQQCGATGRLPTGPLHGISGDMWAALAVAIYAAEVKP